MNVFIARQPIFRQDLTICGYELLYRSSTVNAAAIQDGTAATSDVIANSLMLTGLDKISEDKVSFINFTNDLILAETPTIFDPETIYIELVEAESMTPRLFEACRALKEQGYRFAVDHYTPSLFDDRLLKLVDIAKIDFQSLKPHDRKSLARQVKPYGVKLLAMKIETYSELLEAKENGYSYFQGYFFQEPEVIKNKTFDESLQIYLRILEELNQPEPRFPQITRFIESDVSLAFRILKLVNSPAFYSVQKIDSIENALVRIGLKEIRKVISILLLRNINPSKPHALSQHALVRARFAELIALELDLKKRSSEFFILGLFSMIDAMMDCDIQDIVDELPLHEDVKNALKGTRNRFKDILDLIKLYERGYWELVSRRCMEYSFDELRLPALYLEAVTWTQESVDD